MMWSCSTRPYEARSTGKKLIDSLFSNDQILKRGISTAGKPTINTDDDGDEKYVVFSIFSFFKK